MCALLSMVGTNPKSIAITPIPAVPCFVYAGSLSCEALYGPYTGNSGCPGDAGCNNPENRVCEAFSVGIAKTNTVPDAPFNMWTEGHQQISPAQLGEIGRRLLLAPDLVCYIQVPCFGCELKPDGWKCIQQDEFGFPQVLSMPILNEDQLCVGNGNGGGGGIAESSR